MKNKWGATILFILGISLLVVINILFFSRDHRIDALAPLENEITSSQEIVKSNLKPEDVFGDINPKKIKLNPFRNSYKNPFRK